MDWAISNDDPLMSMRYKYAEASDLTPLLIVMPTSTYTLPFPLGNSHDEH